MGIRVFLALLFAITSTLSVVCILLFNTYAGERVLSLATIDMLAAGLLVFLLVLTLFIFLVISHFVVRPLACIIDAMKEFAKTGRRLPIPSLTLVPREIRVLAGVFLTFIDSVERLHKQDLEISRVKSDFISTAAHQLRTPLTGIRWALEALEKEDLTESQKALVKSARDKSRDLVETVGTLLDISAIESGKYKYLFERADLARLAEEVASDFAELSRRSQVSLTYQPSPESVPSSRFDRGRVKWVLQNLIENALRYTPAGGAVVVYPSTAPGIVSIHVRDTGIGIPAQDRGNIFERFYRAQNAVSKENQGNGLGLYIARTIATDHGGELSFSANTEGPGTTFTLSLPEDR